MASSIQLLRSTNAQERPFSNNLLEGQPALNLNSTEPGLFFKATDGSLVKVGPAAITADGSPPNASATGSTGNTVGEMWLDKSIVPPVLKIYDGATWVDAGSGSGGGSNVSLLRWTRTAIGGETSLSGPDDSGQQLAYTPGLEQLYLNGVLLERGTDYVGTNGTSFSNLAALTAGDIIVALIYSPFSVVTIPDGSITNEKLADSTITSTKVNDISSSKLSYLRGETGAQQRAVKSKLDDIVSVLDFHLSTSTDHSDAIENATKTGKTVFFPSGTYYVTRTLDTNGYLNWVGEPGSIIDVSGVPDSSFYVFLQNRGGTVNGITIEMGGSDIGYEDGVSNTVISSAWDQFTCQDGSGSVVASSSGGSLTTSALGYSVTATKLLGSNFLTVTPASNFVGKFRIVSNFVQLPDPTGTDWFVAHADQYSQIVETSSYLIGYTFELYDSGGTFVRTWNPSTIRFVGGGGYSNVLAINSSLTGSGITQFKVRLTFSRPSSCEPAGSTKFFTDRFYIFKGVNSQSSSGSSVGTVFLINNNAGFNNPTAFDSCEFRNASRRGPAILNGGSSSPLPTSEKDLMNSPSVTNCRFINSSGIGAQKVNNLVYTNNFIDMRVKYSGTYSDSLGRSMNGEKFFHYSYRNRAVSGVHWNNSLFANNTLVGGHWCFEVTPNMFQVGSMKIPMRNVMLNNRVEGVDCAVSGVQALFEGNYFSCLQGWNTHGLEVAGDTTDCQVIGNKIVMGFSFGGNPLSCSFGPLSTKCEVISNYLKGKVGIRHLKFSNSLGKSGQLSASGNVIETFGVGILSFGGDCFITGNTLKRDRSVQFIEPQFPGSAISLEDRDLNNSGGSPVANAFISGNLIESSAGGAVTLGRPSSATAAMVRGVVTDNIIDIVGDTSQLLVRIPGASYPGMTVSGNTLVGLKPSAGYFTSGGSGNFVSRDNRDSAGNPVRLATSITEALDVSTSNPYTFNWFSQYGEGVWDVTLTFSVTVDGSISPTAGTYLATAMYRVLAQPAGPGSSVTTVIVSSLVALTTQAGTALGGASSSFLKTSNSGDMSVQISGTPGDTTGVSTEIYAVKIS